MFLVLVAALLHASWNAFVKAGNDKLLSIGLMHACSGLLGLCLLPFFPLPDPASWPYIALSVALHWGYYLFLINGYKHGDLGVVYPLARGSAPLLIAVSGTLVAGEGRPSGLADGSPSADGKPPVEPDGLASSCWKVCPTFVRPCVTPLTTEPVRVRTAVVPLVRDSV